MTSLACLVVLLSASLVLPSSMSYMLGAHSHAESNLLGLNYLRHGINKECVKMVPGGGLDSCGRFGAQHSLLPNFQNHGTLEEANTQLRGWDQVVSTGCSPELPFLICTYYFPSCQQEKNGSTRVTNIVTPCRDLCERVKQDCSPILARYNASWPETFHCDALQNNSNGMRSVSHVNGDHVQNVFCVDQPPKDLSSAPVPTEISNDGEEGENDVSAAPASEEEAGEEAYVDCPENQCESPPAQKQTFRLRTYDWVVEGRMVSEEVNLDTRLKLIRVNVSYIYHRSKQVRKSHRLPLKGRIVTLHTNDTRMCGCPRLTQDYEYVLAGHYDEESDQLKLLSTHGMFVEIESYSSRNRLRIKRLIRHWMKKLYRKKPVLSNSKGIN